MLKDSTMFTKEELEILKKQACIISDNLICINTQQSFFEIYSDTIFVCHYREFEDKKLSNEYIISKERLFFLLEKAIVDPIKCIKI